MSSGSCLLLSLVFLFCSFRGYGQTTTTRIEENDPSIAYSGAWYTNPSSSNSNGSAALTNAAGARAIVSFSGTGITWIGVGDPWSGVARVYLDGTLNTIDTYGSDTQYRRVLFTARGLSPGPHTLSIEVAHMRDANARGSWVWIDAFDIENGSGVIGGVSATTGRVEQNNPALIYTGIWFLNTNPAQSGGTATLSTDPGSHVTITFNGTSVRWIAYRDEWSGIANVYVDGTLKGKVDTYLSPSQAQSTSFSIDSLPPGSHTLTIEVTGTHSDRSAGSWIWVDAFDVAGTAANSSP
jgi:hypothetical protein